MIIQTIHSYIIDGKLKPGAELPPERTFAEQMGVSRFSLREALRAAQVQGLIEIQQGKRPRVAEPTSNAAADVIALTLKRKKRTLLDLIEVRMAIETEVVKKAALKATDKDIRELEETIKNIKDHPDDHNFCIQEDIRFHDILMRVTENPIFPIMIGPLTELLKESRMKTIQSGVDHIVQGNSNVLKAIRDRDPDQAYRAMREHLELAEKDIKQP